MRIYLRLLVVSLLLFAGNIVYAEAQQEKRVTGTVTSEGEPLPGVSVQLKGASSGTITDIDGKYSTEVPATEMCIRDSCKAEQEVINVLSVGKETVSASPGRKETCFFINKSSQQYFISGQRSLSNNSSGRRAWSSIRE